MQHRQSSRAGFTLIELLVSIVAATLVMAAAVTLLLMGIRLGAFGGGAAQRQSSVRTIQTLLSEKEILEVRAEDSLWEIIASDGENEYTLLSFDGSNICTAGSPLLSDVEEATLAVTDGTTRKLLTLTVKKDGITYTLSAAFGSVTPQGGAAVADSKRIESTAGQEEKTLAVLGAGQEGRREFLQLLFSQMESTGQIIGGDGTYGYYTEWYIGTYTGEWNEDTPWCACFLSWAAEQVVDMQSYVPRFADVQGGVEWFQHSRTQDGVITLSSWKNPSEAAYTPGDLVFFDFDGDGKGDHIGAVLYEENGKVFTLEGNVSDRVAVVSYRAEDVAIMGYASLYWK